jgi:hypothetical protein
MGLYTSIHFTPTDRTWIAPPEWIRCVAAMLGATAFDHFNLYREISSDPALDDDERFEQTLSKHKIPVENALLLHRAGSGYWTHMMFPCLDFMKGLMAEVIASLPESLCRDFAPWDTSISNGHWNIYSYDEGTPIDGGACAFTMSASGCPSDLNLYLEQFRALEGVKQLQRRLEDESHQSWTALISLT